MATAMRLGRRTCVQCIRAVQPVYLTLGLREAWRAAAASLSEHVDGAAGGPLGIVRGPSSRLFHAHFAEISGENASTPRHLCSRWMLQFKFAAGIDNVSGNFSEIREVSRRFLRLHGFGRRRYRSECRNSCSRQRAVS